MTDLCNDHRIIGKKWKIFKIDNKIGKGLILWLPNGAFIFNKVINIWNRFHEEFGYSFVRTPHIAKRELWEISKHTQFHGDNIFSKLYDGNVEYLVKPSNCPLHILSYISETRNYKELPIRFAELSAIYRKEHSGNLLGLFRTRSVTQDDAHIFCTLGDIESEIVGIIDLVKKIFKHFGFTNFRFYVGQRDQRSVGIDKVWDLMWDITINSIKNLGIDFDIIPGKATYYAPRIGVNVIDSNNKFWPLPDIQVDSQIPKLFNLKYSTKQGIKQPVMIHRTVLGSIERFIALLLEHYATSGLPISIAPIQIAIIFPEKLNNYELRSNIAKFLKNYSIRYKIIDKYRNIGKNIKISREQGIPFVSIVEGFSLSHEIQLSLMGPDKSHLGNKLISEVVEILTKVLRIN